MIPERWNAFWLELLAGTWVDLAVAALGQKRDLPIRCKGTRPSGNWEVLNREVGAIREAEMDRGDAAQAWRNGRAVCGMSSSSDCWISRELARAADHHFFVAPQFARPLGHHYD
jgi:hypothetical protein